MNKLRQLVPGQFCRLHRLGELLQILQTTSLKKKFFYIFFWRAIVCRLCRPFMICEGCLDSNPEYCRSKLARYRLSHPSLYLATHPKKKTKTVFRIRIRKVYIWASWIWIRILSPTNKKINKNLDFCCLVTS
jgi:hypothetical protein